MRTLSLSLFAAEAAMTKDCIYIYSIVYPFSFQTALLLL